MYLEYYGLTEPPFDITPNPRFLFYSAKHREAFNHLLYGIRERKGFVQMTGEVGAGKTTLVKAICEYLGVQGNTASPTFSLVNQYSYRNPDGSEAFFHHLDLYRLQSAQEAFDIGLEDLLYDPWYCVIEWPQLAENLLPDDAVRLEIEILGETERRIRIL